MNKFITQVAPPSNKINNSVFHLQNKARPLYSNVHSIFLKYLHQFPQFLAQLKVMKFSTCLLIYFIFINCLMQSDATWQKTTTL